MKTQFIILLLTMITFGMHASGNPISVIEDEKILIVPIAEGNLKNVHIQIKDESGSVIFKENVSKPNGRRKYDLRNLPDGQYMIEISNSQKIITRNFNVNGSKVVLSEDVQTVFKPVINWSDRNLEINLLSSGKDVVISILDDDANEIFKQNHNTMSIHRRYDISSLPKGEYTVKVTTAGRTFEHFYAK